MQAVKEVAFPSPLGDSILITARKKAEEAAQQGFRPLSGIQFSLPTRGTGQAPTVWFPSPLGDSILITAGECGIMAENFSFRPLSGIQFSLPSTFA